MGSTDIKALTWEGIGLFEKLKEGSQYGYGLEREMEIEVIEEGRSLTAGLHGAKVQSRDYPKPLFKKY